MSKKKYHSFPIKIICYIRLQNYGNICGEYRHICGKYGAYLKNDCIPNNLVPTVDYSSLRYRLPLCIENVFISKNAFISLLIISVMNFINLARAIQGKVILGT